MREIILLNITGQDHPGLTVALTEVLAENGRLVNIGLLGGANGEINMGLVLGEMRPDRLDMDAATADVRLTFDGKMIHQGSRRNNAGVGHAPQIGGPAVFIIIRSLPVPDFLQTPQWPQVIHMPVRSGCDPQMVSDPGAQPPRSTSTARIGIPTGRKIEPT